MIQNFCEYTRTNHTGHKSFGKNQQSTPLSGRGKKDVFHLAHDNAHMHNGFFHFIYIYNIRHDLNWKIIKGNKGAVQKVCKQFEKENWKSLVYVFFNEGSTPAVVWRGFCVHTTKLRRFKLPHNYLLHEMDHPCLRRVKGGLYRARRGDANHCVVHNRNCGGEGNERVELSRHRNLPMQSRRMIVSTYKKK